MHIHLRTAALCLAAFTSLVPVSSIARECKEFKCADWTYYANSSKNKVVGHWSNCPGRKGLKGKRTQWVEKEQDSYEICASTPTNLPCEFTSTGCKKTPQ